MIEKNNIDRGDCCHFPYWSVLSVTFRINVH
jgi:hypothetical protein